MLHLRQQNRKEPLRELMRLSFRENKRMKRDFTPYMDRSLYKKVCVRKLAKTDKHLKSNKVVLYIF